MDAKQSDLEKINKILNGIHNIIIKSGKWDHFKNFIHALHGIENKELLRICYNNSDTEFISLICKYNKKKHLRYLLYESHILHYLTSENEHTETKCKEDAFYYAMRSNDFDILEMLYDYWSGDLHWLGHKKEYDKCDIQNLKQLHSLLVCAFNRYVEHIRIKGKVFPQNTLNIKSLILFNDFQKELYSKLHDLKNSLITWEDEPEDIIRRQETYAIRNMILVVFTIYKKYSEQMLSENNILNINYEIMEEYSDTSSLIFKMRLFLMYEKFFRKLDYNFCLLILDNLHLLKLRLSMPKYSYQEMENKLYYFIYHLSTKWRLHLPKKTNINANKCVRPLGTMCYLTFDYEYQSIYSIVYLERRDFEKAMKCFEIKLRNINIEKNLRSSKIKLPNEDNNSLMLLPHLRDDYSLKRISQHITQLYSINSKYGKQYAFLFIERTLQVVGEFLKSTDESLHLQQSTEALVKAELSVEVVNDLKALRDLLCHAKNGEFLKRIEMEMHNTHIFDLILKELMYVKKKIDEVIRVHRPILERDLIHNAICILQDRKDEMPEIVAKVYYHVIDDLTQIPMPYIRNEVEKDFYEKSWAPLGLSKSLMQEVRMLASNTRRLLIKRNRAVGIINNTVVLKYPFYKEKIHNSLNFIMDNMEKWRQINKNLKEKIPSMNLKDYPNEDDTNKIKSHLYELLPEGTPIQYAEVNKLFANVERHWKFVENLLQFIVLKTKIFNGTVEELKFSLFTSELKTLSKYSYKTNDVKKSVIKYLNVIETTLSRFKYGKIKSLFTDFNLQSAHLHNVPKFAGIEEFTCKLTAVNILFREEKKHLINTLTNNRIFKNNIGKSSAIELMISKIKNDIAIPKKEFIKFIELTELERKSHNMLINLVMGYHRNPMLAQCLNKRVLLLRETIKHESPNQLITQYKLDKTFRVLLEVLLFDIFIILECNKSDPLLKKSSKLLTEINLRNILTHGSPLLEVVGNVLDANDLPTELVAKALDFSEDYKSIDALCALIELDFDFTQIESVKPNSKFSALLNEFKTSSRWKKYLKLLPNDKRNINEKQKKVPVIDESSTELLKAVIKKDYKLVQGCIDKGGNVNFVDNHKKAIVHYAAMKGSVNTLDVLIKNKADVNIRNEENNLTALHYSAMNNFIDSVIFLLKNGADCLALDDKGRTPVYWANQRNHVSVSRILVQAMKKYN